MPTYDVSAGPLPVGRFGPCASPEEAVAKARRWMLMNDPRHLGELDSAWDGRGLEWRAVEVETAEPDIIITDSEGIRFTE